MKTERVDDLPLIISILESSHLSKHIDIHFPVHGNWTGESNGKLLVCFLSYILSCSDHRLSHVEEWGIERIETLRHLLSCPAFDRKDLTDDRLGDLLSTISDDKLWNNFESELNKSLIGVYNLDLTEPIRADACIAQSFKKEDELFQMGYSKQHRADLPQLKIMLATLDPLGMPLFSLISSGNTSDDVLYEPIERRVVDSLGQKGLFFVGDCKMSSLSNRSYLATNGHFYLCPLSELQCSEKQLLLYLEKNITHQCFYEETQKGIQKLRAKAFEIEELVNQSPSWVERRIVVYSPTYAKTQCLALENRLTKTKSELGELFEAKQGKSLPKDLAQATEKVNQILQKHRTKTLISVKIDTKITTKSVRKYKDRPAQIQQELSFELEIKESQELIETQQKMLGWRVYASNAPISKISTIDAIDCYRNEYKIEQKFNELINKITALMPIFLQKNDRIVALVRVLLLALKFSSIIQFQIRQNLKTTQQGVNELYPGNPTRTTNEPTIALIFRAFQNITLVNIKLNETVITQVSQLKPIQLKLLELLNLKPDIYYNLNQIQFST